MRLIDADELMQEMKGWCANYDIQEALGCVMDSPTINAIPISWLEEQMSGADFREEAVIGSLLYSWACEVTKGAGKG